MLVLLLLVCASAVAPSVLHRAARVGNVTALRAHLASSPALSLEEDIGGETPLLALLSGWHSALESGWPSISTRSFNASLFFLLERGADPSNYCPTLDAAVYRNVPGLTLLLRTMNSTQLGDCLSAPDAHGSTLAHHVAATPSSGLARLLFRARRFALRHPQRQEPFAELCSYLGLNRSAPLWEPLGRGKGLQSNKTVLTAAALEAVIGLSESPVLTSAYERATWAAEGSSNASASVSADGRQSPGVGLPDILQSRNLLGLSPLDIACIDGRSHVVHWLLQRLGSCSTSIGKGNGSAAQPTCAHFATANGHRGVLIALNSTYKGRRLLKARSAEFGTPCDVARRGGRLLRGALETLTGLGVCPTTSRNSSENRSADSTAKGKDAGAAEGAECPHSHFSASASASGSAAVLLHLPPSFSHTLHQAAGWAVASREHLLALHLPASLLHPPHTSEATQQQNTTFLPSWVLSRACPLPALPLADVLLAAPMGTSAHPPLQAVALQALRANLTALPRPLLLRPHNATAAALHAAAHFSRAALGAAWGHLQVEAATVPYARAYGNAGAALSPPPGGKQAAFAPVRLADFLALHMPPPPQLPVPPPALLPLPAGAPPAVGSAAAAAAAAATLPAAPPYVFDSRVLRNAAVGGNGTALGGLALHLHAVLGLSVAGRVAEEEGAAAAASGGGGGGAQQLPPFPSLAQLSVGPPLSGAPPHFHRGAVNVLHSGLKLWHLVPPGEAAFVDEAALAWWRVLLGGRATGALGSAGAYLFLQGPGDVVVIPSLWGHSVLNLADSVGVAYE